MTFWLINYTLLKTIVKTKPYILTFWLNIFSVSINIFTMSINILLMLENIVTMSINIFQMALIIQMGLTSNMFFSSSILHLMLTFSSSASCYLRGMIKHIYDFTLSATHAVKQIDSRLNLTVDCSIRFYDPGIIQYCVMLWAVGKTSKPIKPFYGDTPNAAWSELVEWMDKHPRFSSGKPSGIKRDGYYVNQFAAE